VESTKANDATDGQGRESAARSKVPQHAVEEAAKRKTLEKLAKGGVVRRIVKELTSRGGSQTIRGKVRVRQAIRRILSQTKATGGKSSEPSRAADTVRELLNQVGK